MKFTEERTKVADRRAFIRTLIGGGAVAGLSFALGTRYPQVLAVAPSAAWLLANNTAIQWKDSGGTARSVLYLDASNNMNVDASTAVGHAILNAGTGKQVQLAVAGNNILTMSATTLTFAAGLTTLTLGAALTISGAGVTFGSAISTSAVTGITPSSDGGSNIGTSSLRFNNIIAGSNFQLFATLGAANPVVQITNTSLSFGLGTTNAVDTILTRNAAGVFGIAGTQGLIIGASTGVTAGTLGTLVCPLKAAAGAPNDAAGGNVDGAIVVSSGDTKIYVRVGGAWKGVAVA